MKIKLNDITLPCLILGLGGIGAALRRLMFAVCVDEKGLLTAWNFPRILVALLCAATVALVVTAVWARRGSNRYPGNFPASLPGGIAAMLAAAGILVLLVGHWDMYADRLAFIWRILGILSIPCMILAGLCRIWGRRPFFLFHGIPCMFFALHLTNFYRVWSGEPQLASYLWQLLASVGLALTAYQHTAFDVGMGKRRRMLAISLLTGFSCLLAVADEGTGSFYLTCGLWAIGNLCALTPPPRRRRPIPETPPQTPDA